MNSTAQSPTSCLGRLLVILAFLWVVVVSFIWQFASHLEVLIAAEWAMITQALMLVVPLAALTFFWKAPRERAIFRAWLLASGYLLLLTPARLYAPVQSQWVLITQLLLSLLFLAFIWFIGRPRDTVPASAGYLLLAVAGAAAVAYPWLWWGALGSLLDTLLALGLGLVVGLNAGLLLGRTWLSSLTQESRGRGWDIFTGGLVTGAALLIIASGLSFNGGQLRLMLVLPGLGWLGMALSYSRPPAEADINQGYSWRPLALLGGLASAVIIATMDTDALAFVAQDPLSRLTLLAALLSALVSWALALMAILMRGFWGRPLSPALAASGAAFLWLAGLVIYFLGGQPGFYGDRLFVVFKAQADVSAAAGIEDFNERRRFVYTTLVDHADRQQQELRWYLDSLGIGYRSYYLVNALEVESGLVARLLLSTRSEIDRILYSPHLRPVANLTVDSGPLPAPTEPQWNLTNIGADRVWNELGIRGEGIIIGQSDSGVQWDHPELLPGYRGRNGDHNYNWLDPWRNTPEPVDFGGHGTHTLGSVLGQTVGVAPGAQWIACANLTRNVGNPALYLDCWQFMLAPYPQQGDPFFDGNPSRGAHILNNSWGCPDDSEGCDPDVLLPAVQALRAAGVFVEVSAGNDGPGCATVQSPPAIYDEVFSTGAVDENNNLALFSSVGPVTADGSDRTKPDIVAPGVQVWSAFPNSTYSKLDGTSMAGPHVTGVVALMWAANPDIIGDIDRTEQILIETATPFSGTLAGLDLEIAMTQLFGEEMAEAVTEDLPESEPAAVETGTCISGVDLGQVPNNIAGYGVVNAYEAVKRALRNP